MARTVITTTPLGVARELWRFGEDELCLLGRALTPQAVAELGVRAGELRGDRSLAEAWGGGVSSGLAITVASIERLEGARRLPKRRRRRPEAQMPEELVASEAERWDDPDLAAVSHHVDAMLQSLAPEQGTRRAPWRRRSRKRG